MADKSRPAIRNKPLRLTLSGHERQYIDVCRAQALRSVKALTVLLLLAAAAIITATSLYVPRDYVANPIRAEEKIVDGRVTYVDKHDPATTQLYIFGATMLLSSVVGFVAALKLVFAVIELLKFRAYRNDHEKFLKHYRRRA